MKSRWVRIPIPGRSLGGFDEGNDRLSGSMPRAIVEGFYRLMMVSPLLIHGNDEKQYCCAP
jgi:hypothetical protein